ncbi:MAG TPA: XdhC family protein [Gemmatimonadales bacterium]|nr:XdhC family protein [Gemmatimonadales bacterium]
MRDLMPAYERLWAGTGAVGRAVVTSVWGSAPRHEGAAMLATSDGSVAGSVCGGCVESAAAAEIVAAIERGSPRLVTVGVSDQEAWAVGLACGGTIRIFVEPAVRPEVLAAARGPGGEVIATVIEGPGVGASLRVSATGSVSGEADLPHEVVREAALAAMRREASGTVTLKLSGGAASVFLEVFPRQPRLVIVGATEVAATLVPFARRLGYRTIVTDGRAAFLTRERLPDADELIPAWPEEAFGRIGLDTTCYVCLLSHDPKFDEPALRLALRSQAAYIGAIGSRKTQAARRERLAAEGFTPEEIGRVHGPIGLPLGGRAPAETALAILAEVTMVRYSP